MLSLFILGSFGFWILLIISSIIIIASLEAETPATATISMIVSFSLLAFCGNFNIVGVVLDKPITSLILLLAYFVVGTLWSVVKWWFYVLSLKEKYEDRKRGWLVSQQVPNPNYKKNSHDYPYLLEYYSAPPTGKVPIPEELKSKFARYAADNLIPSVKNNKSLILFWMSFWFWSMIWTLLNEPVRKTFNEIFRKLRTVFTNIRNKAFDVSEDMPDNFKLDE